MKCHELIDFARTKRNKMKREATREATRETLLELSSTNIRKVIEEYARKHPDHLGMPMNEFTKRFGISTSTLQTNLDLKGIGTSTMNTEQESLIFKYCILETVEGLGRVLILKDETENIETSKKMPPDNIVDSLTIEYIQNCCSVAELREILLRLDQSDDPRRDLIISANVRKATLLLMNDGIFDVDWLPFDYIENCSSVPILQYIMYAYPPRHQRPLPTFHAAAKKRLEAVDPFGAMFNPFFSNGSGFPTQNPDLEYQTAAGNGDVHSFNAPTLEKRPENKKSEDADYMLALQMSMDYGEDEAVFWNTLSEPYNRTNSDFAVTYIDSCNSTTELRSIISYLEKRRKESASEIWYTTLVPCAKERLQVLYHDPQSKQDFWLAINEPYEFDPGSLVKYVEGCDSIPELESILHRVNTGWRSMLSQPVKKRLETLNHYKYVSPKYVSPSRDSGEIHNDIELGETLKMHTGNRWLTNMVKLEFDINYRLARFAENQSFNVEKIIKKAKAEGRRFFSFNKSVGVVWVDADDITVTEEIHRYFRRERMYRFRKNTLHTNGGMHS
jgi:hypothetical protein